MTILKPTIDRAISLGAAVAAPVLTLCVDQHWLSAMSATDVGAIVAAAVGAYHGGAIVQRKRTTPSVADSTH